MVAVLDAVDRVDAKSLCMSVLIPVAVIKCFTETAEIVDLDASVGIPALF